MNEESLNTGYQAISARLLAARNEKGYWTGTLSNSALSTAVAIVALKKAGGEDQSAIDSGLEWLHKNINQDGGYGDTPESASNVSTTLLCYGALRYCASKECETEIRAVERWLEYKGLDMNDLSIPRTILKHYGKDYTFSIPILSMLTLCGVLSSASLKSIPRLPFEFTLLPASWYRFLNLRVVSYALPALIAVGIYLQTKRKRNHPFFPSWRNRFIRPAVNKLIRLVPESGGFLEAIPLTGFVIMCLLESGQGQNPIITRGLSFLRRQQKNDGGWPIDTDLSTWVSTLSIKAFGPDLNKVMDKASRDKLRDHLLGLQYQETHPFNGARPGGWGWTSFSGSVPDADDTPGAILALLELYEGQPREITAIEKACSWLIQIQNRDGGFPTFCKGWGKLPFDRSCADLTGHALLALIRARKIVGSHFSSPLNKRLSSCISRATAFLMRHQDQQGSWIPLWFGNQHTSGKTNPVYGTAKVCIYLKDGMDYLSPSPVKNCLQAMIQQAEAFLISQQNSDGSWGGGKGTAGSREETALALAAIARKDSTPAMQGWSWLENNAHLPPAPIGLYFSLLWYHEELYPLIYQTEAYRRIYHLNQLA